MLLNLGDSCDVAYEVPGAGKPKVVRRSPVAPGLARLWFSSAEEADN